jgi:hypothetical protein
VVWVVVVAVPMMPMGFDVTAVGVAGQKKMFPGRLFLERPLN